ncbi:MAG TPA: Grx4 family monothiol glutaredoxin [Gammaproteobacteria bacterium]|jgi:monothiol glutaredoxin|nr:Grx4 family monothiol glutaredoxin [Gammaproteobacteria bacterium]
MDIQEKIKQQITDNPVLLYMKGTPDFPQCGFSAQTVQALKQCDTEFAFVNVLEEPEIRATLKEVSNWPTFPQLFVNGELVGGCDIVTELYHSGELKAIVQGAAQQKAS